MTIDLRSDTVTKPTPGMLDAMLSAEVGDDVFGEDPTINRLEEKLAGMFGHEAGLFCPSGTMTNQVAINVHTQPGDEVICADVAHIYLYEGGGIARNSGASVRLLSGDRGRITASQVAASVNDPSAVYLPRTRLVSVEDTTNRGGGAVYEVPDLEEISEFCQEQDFGLHLDGARVFNALMVNQADPRQYGTLFDSVSICLSKGLGAPAGSVLLGSKSFIDEGRRVRKAFGGGMRQAGYLAAAGIYALDHHVDKLAADHEHTAAVGAALAAQSWVKEVLEAQTNILVFELASLDRLVFLDWLEQHGVKAMPFGADGIRMVFHYDVSPAMVDRLIDLIGQFAP